MNEVELIKRRFNDLARASYKKNVWQYSKFLNLTEQDILITSKPSENYYLFGGYDGAERCIAVFGNVEDMGYDACPPIVYIEVAPVNEKFSDTLTHRDFLGALMSLGINRDMIGDIIIYENSAIIICIDSVSELILNEIDKIKHTTVKCSVITEIPVVSQPDFRYEELIVSSERIDVLISGVYNLSRNESQMLIKSERVFCNSVTVKSVSFIPISDQIISVRGYGRFIYDGILRKTKKERLVVSIKRYC